MSIRATITRWRSTTDTRGTRLEIQWEAFFRDLHACAKTPIEGERSWSWSAATFRGDRRKKENVESLCALMIDLEHPDKECEIDPARLGCPTKAGDVWMAYYGFVHTTRNHRPDAPRSRVILPLSRRVTVEEYVTLAGWAAKRTESAGLRVAVAESKNPACLWYPPALPRVGVAECFMLGGNEVDAIDVDTILERIAIQEEEASAAAPPPKTKREPNKRTKSADDWPVFFSKCALDRACEALASTQKGVRNDVLTKEAYAMGGFLHTGFVTEGELVRRLCDAITGWDKESAGKDAAIIKHQVVEGAKVPRAIPEKRSRSTWAPSDYRTEDTRHEERRTIQIGTDIHRVTDEACEALGAALEVYQREGELVRVVRATEADQRRGLVEGTPTIRTIGLPTLRESLSRCAQWVRTRSRTDRKTGEVTYEEIPAIPPDNVVSAVLARGAYPRTPPLTGVVEVPTLRIDGSVLDGDGGYDAATGLLYEPSCEVPRIADRPSQADAHRALEELKDVFADFPFASEPARYVPIAMLLTIIARHAIAGPVPMFLTEASMRASGKGLAVNVASTIATGRAAPVATYPADEVELEKMLASFALAGTSLVALDNLTTPLGGGPLDKVLTTVDRVALRVLGRSEMRELPWRAVIAATGNNVVMAADTPRRTLVCRLEPNVERPEERTDFRHLDLLAHVRQHRGRLVAAALTILRAYVVAGRPNAGEYAWGSFEEWARLIPPAIVNAGGPNVLACRAVSIGVPDPETEALRALLVHLPRLDEAGRGLTARSIVELLHPRRERGEPTPEDGWTPLRDAIETLCPSRLVGEAPAPQRLGKALRKVLGRVTDGRRLKSHKDRDDRQVWSVEVLGAGDAGVCGGSPNPSRARLNEGSGSLNGNGLQHPPPLPALPAHGRWAS